jgi:hypothetical protein
MKRENVVLDLAVSLLGLIAAIIMFWPFQPSDGTMHLAPRTRDVGSSLL